MAAPTRSSAVSWQSWCWGCENISCEPFATVTAWRSHDWKSAMLEKPGFVESKLLQWLTREAQVSHVETLSEHFRLVYLNGASLKDHDWVVGQKMQMQLGGFVSRT